MGPDVIAYVQVAGKVLVSLCLDNNEDNNYCIRNAAGFVTNHAAELHTAIHHFVKEGLLNLLKEW